MEGSLKVYNALLSLMLILCFVSPEILAGDHTLESRGAPNPARNKTRELTSEEAAKLYFQTLLLTFERPQIADRLEAALTKNFRIQEVNFMNGLSLTSESLEGALSITMGLFFANISFFGDDLRASFIGSGVILGSSVSIVGGKVYLDGQREKHAKAFSEVERKSIEKEVQAAVSIRPGLLGKILKWTPAETQKFTNAYRNAIHVDLLTTPGEPRHSFSPGSEGSVEISLRHKQIDVLDIIERNELASDFEIRALKQIKDTATQLREIYSKASQANQEIRDWWDERISKERQEHLKKQREYFETKMPFIDVLLATVREVKKDPEVVSDRPSIEKLTNIEKECEAALRAIRRVRALSEYLEP